MLKKWLLFVVLGITALAAGDVITPGAGGGGGGGGFSAAEGNGVIVVNGSICELQSNSCDVSVPFVIVPAGTTHVAVCPQAGGFCASGWVPLNDWQTTYSNYTCASKGMVEMLWACTNNASSGSADYCVGTYVEIQDNAGVCP